MSGAKDKLSSAVEKGAEVTTYIKTYVDEQILLKRSELSRGVGSGLSKAVTIMISSFLGSLIFSFSMISLGFYFSKRFDSFIYGFLAVAGVVLIVLLIILLLRQYIIIKPSNKIAHQMLMGDLPEVDEEEQRNKIAQLETLIEQTSKEIPETMMGIEAKDFLPDPIANISNSSLLKTGLNIANSLVSKNSGLKTVLNTATNLVNRMTNENN